MSTLVVNSDVNGKTHSGMEDRHTMIDISSFFSLCVSLDAGALLLFVRFAEETETEERVAADIVEIFC